MPKVAFTTLGCRLNQAESDAMAQDLAGAGLDPCRPGEDPDVVVVNTCTVTREATKASRMAIRRAVKTNPDAKVVVVGCYAVSDPDEIAAIDGVDAILGNDAKDRFAHALGMRPAVAPLLQIQGVRPASPPARVRANLKVQTGCDEHCSFCIIPTTRGPLRSYDPGALVAEARAKVAAGARELVLTGVHLGKYGYEGGGDERDLIALLRRLLEIEDLWRIRLSSILSRHLTDDVVAFIAGEPRICRYLHVPVQAGDDEVLDAMHRPYRIAEYLASVERVKDAVDGVALATDVIVGFPSESEEAFDETMQVVRRVGFSKLHVFRYSARPGTPSASMPDLPGDVKRDRSKRLIALGNENRSRFLHDHVGTRLEVLVEDERVVDGVTVCSGQTGDYVRVHFEGEGLMGCMVEVVGERVRSDGIGGAPAAVTRRWR